MNTNINLIEEELEEDLVHTVIDSLRNHHTDYCFSNKDFKSILSLAKEAGIGLIYKVFYEMNCLILKIQIIHFEPPDRFLPNQNTDFPVQVLKYQSSSWQSDAINTLLN